MKPLGNVDRRSGCTRSETSEKYVKRIGVGLADH